MKHFLLVIGLFLAMMPAVQAQSPWTGGLNACQFGRMDLDGDGRKDLLVFDRHGNRLQCYLNRGNRGETNYRYTTEYDKAFPKLVDWVIFGDYDGDGLEDIFTYSKGWAGIKVFRNRTSEQVDFELVAYPFLSSWQGGGEVNILATNADYPAILDLDGDGDLDILTFGVMGTFIEKHTNLSMELYGTRDSLVFERTEMCWGRVAESEENNVMYLDTCVFGFGIRVQDDGFRHRGATVTVHDLNGDGLLDLLLADVDYPGLTALINGGDPEDALMVSQTEAFPLAYPVHLPSMPVPFFTDVNNDGVDDLIVSPFDPNPMASVGKESVWLYLNHGSNENPDFQIYTMSFLQDQMIDVGKGAYPEFTDWDGDGLLDLTVKDFDGRLSVFKNVGTAQQPAFEQLPLEIDGGREWSARCYYDVDQDGLMDLVEGNLNGRLTFYQGMPGGVFQWVTDFWGEVDVRDYQTSYYGYSVPTLFDYHGQLLLCVGSEQGRLFLYRVSGASAFEEVDVLWREICPELPETFGIHAAAAVADLNGDGILEVVVGNYSGGLQLFNAEIPVQFGTIEIQDHGSVMIFPNPVQSQLHIVSKRDHLHAVTILNLYGQKIMEMTLDEMDKALDVSDLSSGIYLIRLELEHGVTSKTFLKR